MKSTTFLLCIVASFFIYGYDSASPAVVNIKGTSKVTYDIPVSFSAGDELITRFKAVSSHGRTDGADAAPNYTSYQIVTRAFYLMLIFAPMFWTSGIAFVSSWYRNGIWFGMLKYGISRGGAVCYLLNVFHA